METYFQLLYFKFCRLIKNGSVIEFQRSGLTCIFYPTLHSDVFWNLAAHQGGCLTMGQHTKLGLSSRAKTPHQQELRREGKNNAPPTSREARKEHEASSDSVAQQTQSRG